MEPIITIDLCNDLTQIVGSYLKNNFSDFKLDEKLKDPFNQILYPCLNLQNKKITSKKRTVHFSKEFTCPEELRSGLEMLIKRFENGEDVMPYLSKKALSPFTPDGLLYDWGIYHFHLGKLDIETGKVNRTGPLLFAKIDSENVYCINIYPHKDDKGRTPWCKRDLLRIIDNNWPQIIAHGKVDIMTLHFSDDPAIQARAMKNLDDKAYASLRKAGITTPIVLSENSIYLFPTEGFTGSGHSTELIRKCQTVHNYLKRVELTIQSRTPEDLKYLKRSTGIPIKPNLHFKLMNKKDRWWIQEIRSGLCWVFSLPPLDQWLKNLDTNTY